PAYLAASCRTSPVTEPDPSVRLESDRPCCRTTAEGAAEQWIPPAAPAALRGLQADGVYASSPAPECVFPLVPTPAKSAPSPKVADPWHHPPTAQTPPVAFPPGVSRFTAADPLDRYLTHLVGAGKVGLSGR